MVVGLLLTVALVFFAPSVDLEPTALRSVQAARALQLAMISAALVFTSLLSIRTISFRWERDFGPANDSDLLVLNCTRLC